MAATIEDPDSGRHEPDPTGNRLLRHARSCFCFGPRASRTGWSDWARDAEAQNRWWTKGLTAIMKVREWSEIVAGPKWKTFIRRFNRSRSSGRNAKFQYDPLSYALNFDEGQNGHFDDDDDNDREPDRFRDFSARFAPVKESPVYS